MAIARLILLGMLLWAPLAQSAVIATVNFSHTYIRPLATGVLPSSSINLHFAYSVEPGGLENPDTVVFGEFVLSDSDDGLTTTIGSADDPQFAGFVDYATNGSDDDLRFLVLGNEGGGGGSLAPESFLLHTLVPTTGPDLLGYSITGLELFIDSIAINASAAFGEVNWTVNGQLRFLSDDTTVVPLPGGLLMLLCALATLGVRGCSAQAQQLRFR